MKKTILDAVTIRKKLKDLASDLYRETFPDADPLFPWILVYELPREQVLKSGIILPGANQKQQNKTTFEGIVLKTWRPFHHMEYGRLKSNLKPGDHALFTHYAGQPLSKETDRDFRLVREFSGYALMNDDTTIFGTLQHTPEDTKAKLIKFLHASKDINDWFDVPEVAKKLMQEFVVNPKLSRTRSGQI